MLARRQATDNNNATSSCTAPARVLRACCAASNRSSVRSDRCAAYNSKDIVNGAAQHEIFQLPLIFKQINTRRQKI